MSGHTSVTYRLAGAGSLADDLPALLQINNADGSMMVRVNANCTLDYGDGYDPDEAARIFWQAIAVHAPASAREA